MKIILTKHAKVRMMERDISFEEIKDTIDVPDYTVAKNNKVEAHKNLGTKSLKVIYSKENNFIKVITIIDKWK